MEVGEGITDYTKENTMSSGEIDVVKSSFIFGGNASGKTNVIRAFQLLRQIVVDGTPSNLVTLPIDTFANESGDTNFKIHFTKNGNLYYYELNYDWDAIINECLTMNGVVIFKRTVDEITMPPLIKDLKESLRVNQPLLFFAQTNNVPEAKEAYEWFAQDIINPSLISNNSYNQYLQSLQLFKPLHTNLELKENVLYFLRAADFNIRDIITQEIEMPTLEADKKSEVRLIINFEHEGPDGSHFVINYNVESIGTQIFLLLIMTILENQNNSKLFLIDEFDRSLHPKLVNILLRIFNEWNHTGTQLIATTHDTDILDAPLRTDQIWFVDKSYDGVSTLDSAFDFNEQSIKDIKKNYQDGLYGADQIINDAMMKDILGISDHEEDAHHGETV
ncbi:MULTISPECIES: ATP/GTP-binding protein [Veillonella]|uniref:ATP-binding protein n=1 Tax=Veillonella atypica TaxID=39777 RepID=A0AAJ1QA73_9FIRM|nr:MULTISPECIES: ATP-binding protein [Veillonella]MDK7357328.1 ATP-binding protein [Veillonella atypica]MDU7498704.1 ATP-binding protein [Veillonella sp.]